MTVEFGADGFCGAGRFQNIFRDFLMTMIVLRNRATGATEVRGVTALPPGRVDSKAVGLSASRLAEIKNQGATENLGTNIGE